MVDSKAAQAKRRATGSLDVNKREIEPGDLFVLVRQDVPRKKRFELVDRALALKYFGGTGRRAGFYNTLGYVPIDKDGNTRVRLYEDKTSKQFWQERGRPAGWPKPMNYVFGANVFLHPCTIGVIVDRHLLRPSQWAVVIEGKPYSLSNKVVWTIRGVDEIKVVQDLMAAQNR